MVNWNDPSVLLKDYLAMIKLDHAIAGIYIWETVFTAGFELDVLRGKRPYRWTIWVSCRNYGFIITAQIEVAIPRDPLLWPTCLHPNPYW
ncbi:hypothetical protein BJV78DRAFT_622391 [Lactifluus subvellereus]|nr:hypothetical protein BJV78DRAFT_622391 [Lactifluus subvellereus]